MCIYNQEQIWFLIEGCYRAINIPYLYFKKMGIDKENRLVDVIYDENKKEIILKKHTKK